MINIGKRNGRPPEFETEEELAAEFSEYMYYCMQYERIPNAKGFCVFADISRTIFYDQEKRFPNTFEKIQFVLEDNTINSRNVPMSIFMLKNHYGYSDRPESGSENVIENIDSDELDQRILKGSAALMLENVEKSTD